MFRNTQPTPHGHGKASRFTSILFVMVVGITASLTGLVFVAGLEHIGWFSLRILPIVGVIIGLAVRASSSIRGFVPAALSLVLAAITHLLARTLFGIPETGFIENTFGTIFIFFSLLLAFLAAYRGPEDDV